MLKAVRNVNEFLGPRVIGMEAASQAEVDKALLEVDRTENKVFPRGGAGAKTVFVPKNAFVF